MPIPASTTKAEQDEELRRLGLHGDDGDDGDNEVDSKRSNARKAKSFAEIDTAAVYAKWNSPKSKTLADNE
jgi:hypothetical protein